MTWRWRAVIGLALVVIALAFARDPAWLATASGGFGAPEQDTNGAVVRRMGGRAWFFVPSDAALVALPLRMVSQAGDTHAVAVRIALNDQVVRTIRLQDEEWVVVPLPLTGVPTGGRRQIRVDLHVNRVQADGLSGVRVGDVVR